MKISQYILGLSETKWKGKGEKNLRGGGKLYLSGNNRSGRNGVAVMVNKNVQSCIENVRYISDRIIILKLRFQKETLKVIQIYAPQVGCSEEEKMDFENVLENHIESANIVMGDFNAQVSKDRKGFEQVLGCFGYGGRNEEGERLLDLCQRNGMKIANSWFMKRESHVITRYSWDGRTKSVIDYILIDREWGEKVTNVKVIPSVSADGDYRVLVGQWKMNQCVKNRKQKKVMRIRDCKLKESECAEKYRELITQKFPKEIFCYVEKEWSLFKDTLVKAAQKVCGRTSGKEKIRQTSWWDDTTIQAVRRKIRAWRKWWKTKNDKDHKRYIEEKKKCKEIVETAKKKAWEEFTKKT
ncbi:craniofacial development protein 2-like [Schistocerca nitens]|uniref:craniofacial development protein 2-like n=1 Tax=Schistocerca nitens TaxID=7011 RepID=UPI0021182CF1|nr:craniofacial development protein 2-like [Schistocerca nitens]